MRWLSVSRCARAFAIIGAYMLCLQSMGLSRLAFAVAADPCCCHSHSPSCRCPVCSRAHALASGRPFLQTCGQQPDQVAIISPDQTLPPAGAPPEPAVIARPPRVPVKELALGPPREVPTPPPLA